MIFWEFTCKQLLIKAEIPNNTEKYWTHSYFYILFIGHIVIFISL